MATPQEYITCVCDQLAHFDNVRYRKMFGEYMVYVNDKPLLLVCDNTVFVKKLSEIDTLMAKEEVGIPYAGAKEHYLLDPENKALLSSVVEVLEPLIPVPKPRKKKTK